MADNEAEIPDLKKKKEEEKKKAGAAWTGAKPGSSPFSGATGGTGVARAAASAGRAVIGVGGSAAGAGGGFFGGISAWLGSIAATLAGKVLLGVLAAVIVMAAAAVVAMVVSGGKTAGGDKGVDLGGVSSSIKVDRGGMGSRALSYASNASHGMLNFGPAAGSSKTAAAPKAGEAPKTEAAPPTATDQLAHDGVQAGESGKAGESRSAFASKFGQLSSGTGSFGKSDVFGHGPKFGESMGGVGKFGKGISSSRGGGLSRAHTPGSRSLNVGKHGMRSSKALAQLRGQGVMNRAMTTSGTTMDAAAAAATAQFEGAKPTEAAPTTPVDGAPAGNPSGGTGGGGATDVPGATTVPAGPAEQCTATQMSEENCYSNGSTCLCPREVQPPSNETPWQDEKDAAEALLYTACALTLVGGILCQIANGLTGSLCTCAAGLALRVIAAIILALAIVCAAIVDILAIVIAAKGGGMQALGLGIAGTIVGVEAGLALAGKISFATLLIGVGIAALTTAMGSAMSKPPDLPSTTSYEDVGSSAPPAEGTPGSGQPQ